MARERHRDRDHTPVGDDPPIPRGEIAGIDDLVDFAGERRAGRSHRRRRRWKLVRRSILAVLVVAARLLRRSAWSRCTATGRSDQVGEPPVDAIVVLGAAQYDGDRRRSSRPASTTSSRCTTRVSRRWSSSPVASSQTIGSPRRSRRRSTSSIAASRPTAIVMETSGRTTYESMAGHRRPARRAWSRPGGHRHRPVSRPARPADRPGRRADGLRLADADLGRPRRQLGPPPSRRGRRRRPRPDHRLRPPLTHPDQSQPMGVYGTVRSPEHPSVVAAVKWSVAPMGSGVTGNTADSGSVVRGSIPLSPAHRLAALVAWRTARRPGARQHGPFV